MVVIIDQGEEILHDRDYSYESIEEYELIFPSHRIIKGTEHDDGLLISGEVKLKPNSDFRKYDLIYVRAELRNKDGGFVESCSSTFKTKYVKGDMLKFGINCDRIRSLEEFSTYDFNLEGKFEN